MATHTTAEKPPAKYKPVIGLRLQKSLTAILAYSILILASLVVILPLTWVFLTSLKEKSLVYQIPPAWVFTPTSENYLALFNKYPFPQYFLNSAIVASITTLLGLTIGGMAAYSMTRFNTGGNFFKGWVLNNRTMPPIVVLIPIFMLASQFKLINKHISLILAYLSFLLPFCIWMLISFFEAIHPDMEEAALVDGASRLQSLFLIVIPLAAPGIAATGILSFLFSWNEFMFALILTGNATRTLPIGVANFLTQRGVEMGELTAATMVMVIPVMLLAFSIRRYLVQGLSFGGVK